MDMDAVVNNADNLNYDETSYDSGEIVDWDNECASAAAVDYDDNGDVDDDDAAADDDELTKCDQIA